MLICNVVNALGQDNNRSQCHSEIDTLTKQEIFKFAEKMPAVHGGVDKLYGAIMKKITSSRVSQYAVESKVVVAFIVNVNGDITGKRIVRNCHGTNWAEQVLDTVDDFKWDPGACDRKAVPVIMLLPMNVCLR